MGQKRVDKEGIKRREDVIERIEKQIKIWQDTSEKTPGMELLRKSCDLGIQKKKKEIFDRARSLAFTTEADRASLSQLVGSLDELERFYYDISDATAKIEVAKNRIAVLVEEIRRAKKGELLETEA